MTVERCTCKFQGRHIGWQRLLTMAREDASTGSRVGEERVRRVEKLEPTHKSDCKQN